MGGKKKLLIALQFWDLSLVGGLGLGLLLQVLRLKFPYYPYKGVPYIYFQKSNVHQKLHRMCHWICIFVVTILIHHVNPHH